MKLFFHSKTFSEKKETILLHILVQTLYYKQIAYELATLSSIALDFVGGFIKYKEDLNPGWAAQSVAVSSHTPKGWGFDPSPGMYLGLGFN